MSGYEDVSPPEFWAPRRGFLPRIPEIEVATDLIDAAADAYLAKDWAKTEKLIREADFGVLGAYAQRIVGAIDPEVHRVRKVPGAPPVAKNRAKVRMPGKAAQRAVFERDGWRCRLCGIRVVHSEMIRLLDDAFPDVVRWRSRKMVDLHGAFRVLCASVDHVLPHSRGGTSEVDNLVAACGPCNFGRNQWTIEEVGFLDPHSVPPVVDRWDGLTRLCR